jgi:hypothetical protein
MVATIMMVLPVGMSIPDWLRYHPTHIRGVVAHGVHHGAIGALTVAHLWLCHRVDLRGVMPRFPVVEEIADDVDIRWLIAEFSGNAEAIAAVVDMERIIKDNPFRNRLCTSLLKEGVIEPGPCRFLVFL